MKKIVIAGIIGLISGILSIYFYPFSYGPGIIFGFLFSMCLYIYYRKNIFFHVGFLAVSVLAYFIALKVYGHFYNENSSTLPLFMSGLVGSFILAVYLKVIYPIKIRGIFLIIACGALAGIPDPDFFRIFPLWQAAVALSIAFAIKTSAEQKPNLNQKLL